jgi:hypothetical protein
MDGYAKLLGKLVALRQGMGARHPDVVERFGPEAWWLLGVKDPPSLSRVLAQEALRQAILVYLSDSPNDQWMLLAAFGLHPETEHIDTLENREDWIGKQRGRERRTARGWVEKATKRLATTAVASRRELSTLGAISELGHVVRRHSVRVLFVEDWPELIEERVVEIIDNRRSIYCRSRLPPGVRPGHEVKTQIRSGRLVGDPVHEPCDLVRYEIEPERVPADDGLCRFTLAHRFSSPEFMAPSCLWSPVTVFQSADLAIRFDARRPPDQVREVDGPLYQQVEGLLSQVDRHIEMGEKELFPDPDGYVRASFENMVLGRVYGVVWSRIPPPV